MNTLLEQQIEGLLYALGKPLSYVALAEMTHTTESEVLDAITVLLTKKERGILVITDGTMAELRIAPAVVSLIEDVRRQENSRDIGRAGLEVISAIIYRGPLTRAEIDFIRGVNSTQILRTLTIRGLIRKSANTKDERSFLYEATTELLASLGATHPRDLPEFDTIKEKFITLESTYRKGEEIPV